jgi:predicted HD phosphohydrolase
MDTPMPTVSFTQMKDGTREEYLLLRDAEHAYIAGTPARLLRELASQAIDRMEGYKITRLDHALQAATRAEREGADTDWIVAALLHDIGDGLAPRNHDRFAAEILRPYLREECTWVVEHHGAFQMVYYAHHYDRDPFVREVYRDHPCYQTCVDFCERWDQSSFDPDYDTLPLDHFADRVHEVFARTPYDPTYIKPGHITGLPPERNPLTDV